MMHAARLMKGCFMLTGAKIIRMEFKRFDIGFNLIASYSSVSRAGVEPALKAAVIGTGPAGFYVTASLFRQVENISVDLFDKQPVPFGLVRFGVAPDHPEVKNCIHQFEKVVEEHRNRLNLFCNVAVGTDLSVQEIRQAYDIVVFAYGSEKEKRLGIGGEWTKNCISGRSFVGWYNGLPKVDHLDLNLDDECAVVIGHGNVALDCARILLSPLDRLKHTDIPNYALDKLAKSRVRKVVLCGRRGPLQVSFTIKELRELINLPGSIPLLDWKDFSEPIRSIVSKLDRPRRRLTELMIRAAETTAIKQLANNAKCWQLKFNMTPLAILSSQKTGGRVAAIELALNKLSSDTDQNAQVITTEIKETISCGLVIYCIGYKTIELDGVPLTADGSVIRTSDGCRVEGMAGAYATGWCARGPRGVIASTQFESRQTANQISQDIASGLVVASKRSGVTESIRQRLHSRNVEWVCWDDWKQIDSAERILGEARHKPREKLTSLAHIASSLRRT